MIPSSYTSVTYTHFNYILLRQRYMEMKYLSGIMTVNTIIFSEHIIKYSWQFSCVETKH